EDPRVVPVGILEGRRHDVLGHGVQPVRQLATPGWPPRGQPVVGPPTHQLGLGAQGLVEGELVELWAILDQADPAAAAEAFITGRVLDDAVERDVVAHDDPSHFGSPLLALSATSAAGPGGQARERAKWWSAAAVGGVCTERD